MPKYNATDHYKGKNDLLSIKKWQFNNIYAQRIADKMVSIFPPSFLSILRQKWTTSKKASISSVPLKYKINLHFSFLW